MKTAKDKKSHYTMDFTNRAIEERMKTNPGFVTVEDSELGKTVVMFSTGLESRMINDVFDFMRGWPESASQSQKLRDQIKRLKKEVRHYKDHKP